MDLRLKELRLRKKLTQQQVADLAGISQSYYTELETGRKTINKNRMEQLAQVLGVSVPDLFVRGGGDQSRRFLEGFEALNEKDQALVMQMIDSLRAASEHSSE